MYEKRFGFHRKPFQSILTADDFFESESYQEIKPTILHAVRSDLGVAILTGPAGTGKTVTLEHFRRMLTSENQVIIFRGGTVRSAADLLYLLHRRLIDATPDPAKEARGAQRNTIQRWEVVNRLQRVADFWGPVILLLDDAHLAGADVFSELRDLLEEDADGRRLVRLMIAGPHVLEEVLAEPAMSDFAQRIRTHVFLEPMRSTESVQYLSQQIRSCGGDPAAVFESKAIERIVAAADGIPRCLNLLADESLMICESEQQARVTVEIVNKALSRLRHLPYSWNVSLYESGEDDEVEVSANVDAEFTKDNAVEIGGGSATAIRSSVSYAADGVIEIGGDSADSFPPKNRPVADTKATTVAETESVASPVVESRSASYSSFEIGAEAQQVIGVDADDDGVFEFGGDAAIFDTHVDHLFAGEDAEVLPELEFDTSIEEFFIDDDVLLNDAIESDSAPSAESVADDAVSEPDAPAFDPKFDAITFASGTLEFEQVNIVTHGAADAPTADDEHEFLEGLAEACENLSATCGADSKEDLANERLLQHLFQPAAEQNHGDNSTLSMTSDSSAAYAADDDDAASDEVEAGCFPLNVDDASGHDRAGSLSNFSPWTPPGKWQRLPERTCVETLSVKSVEVKANERSVAKSVKADRVPVFDRYTWCELGRSVTSEAPRRSTVYNGEDTAVEWPPSLTGIAPAMMYPISEMDDDYVELLTDLGMLSADDVPGGCQQIDDEDSSVWSAYESAAAASVQQDRDERQSVNDDYVAPDKSIEKIQTMLVDEELQAESWFSINMQSVEVVVQDVSPKFVGHSELQADASAETVDCAPHAEADKLPVVDAANADQSDVTSVAANAEAAEEDCQEEDCQEEDCQDALDRVEDVIDTVSSGKRQMFTLPIDIDEVSAFRAASTDTIRVDDAGSSNHGPTAHLAATAPTSNSPSGGHSQGGPDGGSYLVLAEQEVEEQLEQNQYSPQLLTNARARVIAVANELSQLKRAAGAESASAEHYSEVRSFEQRTAHLSVANQDTAGDEDAVIDEKPRSGFSNLFTRLRNMRNR